jgi:HK97 family phage portal protein
VAGIGSTHRTEDRLMSFLSDLAGLFLDGVTPADVRARTGEFPSFDEQMAIIQNRSPGTWRTTSVDDALGSPAIFGAVTLISNTIGSLSMEAFRRGTRLAAEETPRMIQRPNPFTTPRDFYRDTGFYLATRGEAWWWIAVRDPLDGSPMSLFPVPPWEIQVEQNDDNRLRPTIRWADRVMRNEDMRQITYLPGRNGRGVGPLQKCGAAVSVAVESQAWAANFFAGSIPSIVGTTEQEMTAGELTLMDEQWLEKPPGFPRWLTNGLKLSEAPFNPEKAQLNDARMASVGDAARMFTMPGPLLEYQISGSSLTYRNDETIWTDFQRRCLSPNYLEPIEQEMSDLLTRSTVGRFNVKQLLRGSAKERAEVHKLYIEAGVYPAEVAASEEGYGQGGIDYAPIPPSPPQAIPTLLPPNRQLTGARSALGDLHCPTCRKLVGRIAGAAEIMCPRCGTLAAA